LNTLFQKKLMLLILAVLVILNLVVWAGSKLILLDSYRQIEQQAVEENLLRVANAVRNDAENLGTLCADWAVWDDTYQFVQDHNPAYISSNLGDLTLVELNLNALLIFDAGGDAIFGKGMDLETETLADVPPELLSYFQKTKKFWPPQEQFSRQDGLLLLSDGPMLVSFRSILTSTRSGPARGLLVMARWFDEAVVEALAKRTALSLELLPLAGRLSEPVEVVRIHPSAAQAKTIQGDVLLHDLDGDPVFYLGIVMERAMFIQGKNTVAYFQLTFLVVSLVSGGLLYLLLVVARRKRSVAEKRFRYVFENATDGLFVVEKNDQLEFINPAGMKLLGGAADQQQAESTCFSHPELRDLIGVGLQGKVAGPVEISLDNPRHGQKNHLRAYMAPMLGEDGKWHGTIATLQDITREKELEQLKNEFVASAAHELNTPLSIIIGYADLLLSGEYADQDELREFLALINEKSHALEKIVDDLLHLGKIESGNELYLDAEPYDLSAEIRKVADVYQKEHPRHRFAVNLLDGDVVIVADRHRLGQVFDNLLNNAVKYSPDGGTITISSSRFENERLLCVADQGVGLTDEQVGKVFEKFYRVDNSSTAIRGLGLGLNITRNIIRAHGGRIWLESTPGEGTRFYFTLPDVKSNEATQDSVEQVYSPAG